MWEVAQLLRARLGPQVGFLPKKRGPDNVHMKGTCPVGQTDPQVVGDGGKEGVCPLHGCSEVQRAHIASWEMREDWASSIFAGAMANMGLHPLICLPSFPVSLSPSHFLP